MNARFKGARCKDHQGVTVSLSEHADDSLSVTNNEPELSIRARVAGWVRVMQRERAKEERRCAPLASRFALDCSGCSGWTDAAAAALYASATLRSLPVPASRGTLAAESLFKNAVSLFFR